MTTLYESFDAMVAAQRQERREARAAAHAAWIAEMDASIAEAVPIRPRLVSLLNEARRHERQRAEASYTADSVPAHLAVMNRIVRQSHLAHIDQGYRNLLRDVSNRCAGIAKSNAPAASLWGIGSEAIGCFSTMLPWSDGVANRETAPDGTVTPAPQPQPISPTNAVGTSGAFRGGRPPQMASRVVGGIMGMPTIRIQHRDPVPSIPAPRWTVPTRLNTDNRKLAAAVASRRRELQRMKASSCGAQMNAQSSWSGSSDRPRAAASVKAA